MLKTLCAIRRSVRRRGAPGNGLALVGILPGLPSCWNHSVCALHWFLVAEDVNAVIFDMNQRSAVDSEGRGGAAGKAKGLAANARGRDLFRVCITCSILVFIFVDLNTSAAWTSARRV
jgi:hypothetical protein